MAGIGSEQGMFRVGVRKALCHISATMSMKDSRTMLRIEIGLLIGLPRVPVDAPSENPCSLCFQDILTVAHGIPTDLRGGF